ncbi:MAG TPA: hypothetical protein VN661_10650 [Candidatus Acidoferrales bacterium]|nr:hypothetical protein [Candidatus Acidoferrales bacterium]
MPENTLPALLIIWGVVTTALLCVLIYRSALAAHEGDQIFLNSSGEAMAREQRALVARIERLRRPIVGLTVLSGVLLLLLAAVWLLQGFRSF